MSRRVRGPLVALGRGVRPATSKDDGDWFAEMHSEHAEDLEAEDEEKESQDMQQQNTPPSVLEARALAAREGISFDQAHGRVVAQASGAVHVALERARGSAPDPLPSGQQAEAPAAPGVVPPMPAGNVTLAEARAHLAQHLPGWGSLNHDEQFGAMRTLRDLCTDPVSVQLRRPGTGDKPTVLLCLYGGASFTQRALKYLSATTPKFNSLPWEERFKQAQALRESCNVVDVSQ